MSHEGALFGELRSLMHQRPCADSWSALCDLIEAWPAPDMEARARPYIDAHITQWPDQLRVAPEHWLRAIERGDHPVGMRWIKSARMTERSRCSPHALATALGANTLRALALEDHLPGDGLLELSSFAQFAELEDLKLQGTGLGSRGFLRAIERSLPRLTHLNASANELALHAITASRALLPALQSLTLHQISATHEDIDELLAHDALSGLKHLALSAPPEPFGALGWVFFDQLLREGALDHLSSLDISQNSLASGPSQLDVEVLPRLDALDVAHNGMSAGAVTALLSSLATTHLSTLNIGNNPIGALEGRTLAELERLGIERLSLTDAGLTGDAIVGLLEHPASAGLRALAIGSSRLERGSLSSLEDATCEKLDALDISLGYVGPDNFYHITRAPFARLTRLNARWCNLDGRAMRQLATSSFADTLTRLDLSKNRLGDDGIFALAGAEFPALVELDLRGCRLSEAAIRSLIDAPWLPKLSNLGLGPGELDARSVELLATAPRLPHHIRMRFDIPR